MYRRALNIAEMRDLARRRLPRGVFEYVERGAEDEIALATNRAAWDAVKFNPAVLIDVSARSLETELFGTRQAHRRGRERTRPQAQALQVVRGPHGGNADRGPLRVPEAAVRRARAGRLRRDLDRGQQLAVLPRGREFTEVEVARRHLALR